MISLKKMWKTFLYVQASWHDFHMMLSERNVADRTSVNVSVV